MSRDSEPNSYHAPREQTTTPSASAESVRLPRPPGAWYAYVVYCIIMALFSVFCVACGINLALMGLEPGWLELLFIGIVVALISGVLLVMFGAAPFLPRSKSAWIYGFVTIGIGMITWLLPFCIALLIFWLRPKTKAFFRVT